MLFRQFLRIALISYATASFAQTAALDREAENYELNSFSQYQWLPFQGDYFVYYAIPAQGNLARSLPTTRFIQARDITTTVHGAATSMTATNGRSLLRWDHSESGLMRHAKVRATKQTSSLRPS